MQKYIGVEQHMKGTVKFFNRTKNFGFVTGDDGTDYFVHVSDLQEGVDIDEGTQVEFDVVDGDRGKKAGNVKYASAEDEAPVEAEEASPEADEDDESPAEE